MSKTFSEFLLRESIQEELDALSSFRTDDVLFLNGKIFKIDESTVLQDSLEGHAETREDAAKIMKFLRKKGLSATRVGCTGIFIKH